MNKEEYCRLPGNRSTYEYKFTHKLLKQWKTDNNITEVCDIHHRDDTEECRKYNEEHYERWGIDENGKFIEGKYVVFMTRTQHTSHHNKGDNNPMKRPEVREKITGDNNPMKRPEVREKITGDNNPNKQPEVRAKQSATAHRPDLYRQNVERSKELMEGAKVLYNVYKENGGQLKWQTFLKALKNGDITFEQQQSISVYTNGGN